MYFELFFPLDLFPGAEHRAQNPDGIKLVLGINMNLYPN
jgi:hypothetical protein